MSIFAWSVLAAIAAVFVAAAGSIVVTKVVGVVRKRWGITRH
jgi:hypothetical protein